MAEESTEAGEQQPSHHWKWFIVQCLPWIRENMPHLLPEGKLAEGVEQLSIAEGKDENEGENDTEGKEEDSEAKSKKKKRGGGPKKKEAPVTRVETAPDVKLKVAAKLLGKHFACGSSVSETSAGVQGIVIQGDVIYDLPDVLAGQLHVPLDCIFISEDGRETRLA